MMRRPGRDETLIAAAVCAGRGWAAARLSKLQRLVAESLVFARNDRFVEKLVHVGLGSSSAPRLTSALCDLSRRSRDSLSVASA
jgi:hypothetical protein